MVIEIPEWFKRDFYLVTKYYKCSDEEKKELKILAKDNILDAMKCYYFLAREIDDLTTVSAADMVREKKENKDGKKKKY